MNHIDRANLLQRFVEGLADYAVILLDTDGKIASWNLGATNMLGYAAEEVLGRDFTCLYSKEDIAAGKPSAALERAEAQGRYEEYGRRVRQDGTQLDAQCLFVSLLDGQKKLLGFGSLTRDAMSVLRAATDIAGVKSGISQPLPAPKTVLLVDDNKQVLEVVALQLTSLGYKVIAASNGAEALDVLARVPDVDLMLTDVMMPGGMNGREVAEEGRRIHPGLKVLFTSGYFGGALAREGRIDATVRLLVKPYRKHELARRVQEELLG